MSKRFGPTTALHEVSIEIAYGEARALVGPPGAGKSTLAAVLTGQVAPDGGRVELGGSRATLMNHASGIPAGLTVGEALSPANGPGHRPPTVARWRVLRERARRLLETWEIAATPDTPACELTPGERLLTGLAGMLCTPAVLVVLDEPAAQLSPSQVDLLATRLGAPLAAGTGVLCLARQPDALTERCSRVTTLSAGRVVRGPRRSVPRSSRPHRVMRRSGYPSLPLRRTRWGAD